MRKGKSIFIKNHMTRSVETIRFWIKTKITLGISSIAKKNTLSGAKVKFVRIIRTQERITRTTKNFEGFVIRRMTK